MYSPSRSIALQSWYIRVAVVVTGALIFWASGLPGSLLVARADQVTTLSDVLSTSKPDTGANHTITFGTPTGVPADGSTIVVTMPTGFTMGSLGEDDIDITDDGVDLTTDTVCGAVNAAVTVSGQDITIEICSGGGGAIAAASTITIEIGTNATASGTGANQVTNNATVGEYEVLIGGTMADEGYTKIAIIDSVTITGEVQNFFEFTIGGVDTGLTVNADATLTTGTTTATSVPFGIVSAGSEYVLAQDLTVNTNSANGFIVSVFADGDLESSTGATINSFSDGTYEAVPTTWAQPSAIPGSADTYGHWGVTTEDTTLSDDDSFGDALYVGDFVSSAREIMYATSSADAITPDIGSTRVGFKMEVSSMQEAATDYTTRLVYIATPVF